MVKAGIKNNYKIDQLFHQALEDLENVNHSFVAAIYDTIFHCPSFLSIVTEKKLVNTVRHLIGSSKAPLYGHTNRCRIDPPKDKRRTYGWHQEVFYTIPRGRYIQSWAPLISSTTIENGTIEIAVGSHKEGIAKQTWNDIEGRATQIIVEQNIIDKYEQVSVEMELGELLLFSGNLSHRSGSNNSKYHRYSLVGMYHDVSKEDFLPPKLNFDFRGETPREYFKSIMSEKI